MAHPLQYVAGSDTLARWVAHAVVQRLLIVVISGCVLHGIFGSRRSDVIAFAERSFLAELRKSTARSYAASASVDTIEGSHSCARMQFGPR